MHNVSKDHKSLHCVGIMYVSMWFVVHYGLQLHVRNNGADCLICTIKFSLYHVPVLRFSFLKLLWLHKNKCVGIHLCLVFNYYIVLFHFLSYYASLISPTMLKVSLLANGVVQQKLRIKTENISASSLSMTLVVDFLCCILYFGGIVYTQHLRMSYVWNLDLHPTLH